MNLDHIFQPAIRRTASYAVYLAAPAAFLLACALASCVLAYPFRFLAGDFLGFHTLISRGTLVILVLGLVLIGRRMRLGRADIGLATGNREFFAQFRRAFGIGVLMLILHFALLVWIGARGINPGTLDYVRLARLAGKGLLIGLAVGLLEESVFRGFLHAALLRRLPPALAVGATAFYFAALHFVRSELRFAPEQIDWTSSFRFAFDSFGNLTHIQPDSFLALFCAGVFLSCVRLAIPHGLAWCIGIHAGWVFVIKTFKPFTHVDHHSDWNFLLSRFDGVIGYLSAAWITALTMIVVWQRLRQPAIATAR
jgi:membrane protease YdiL (CAAX protease family)